MATTTEAISIDSTVIQPARAPYLYREAFHLKIENARIGMAGNMTVGLVEIGSFLDLDLEMPEASESRAH